ncbi:tRNA-splicing endonuclease subunit sen34-related [Anaeramoeba flamelloides]|uniref:tRNA-intron lyase n=1 Tax=Anaeramoeba flamelloides TaxID=1746091 RepID=A0ABQ8XEJ4_9EUKA|nr:tRNA-splicing endonuclease subunit sen34-related [Anaeramoeba flamelloides]
MEQTLKKCCYLYDQHFFVWDSETILWLRKKHHIVGYLIGTSQQLEAQLDHWTLPLVLSQEEALLCYYQDLLTFYKVSSQLFPPNYETKNTTNKNDYLANSQLLTRKELVFYFSPMSTSAFTKFAVFQDVWKKGYYLTSGNKFGGDFLVYPGDPIHFHARFILTIVNINQKITPLQLISSARVGVAAKKKNLYASFDFEKLPKIAEKKIIGKPLYLGFHWSDFQKKQRKKRTSEKNEMEIENENEKEKEKEKVNEKEKEIEKGIEKRKKKGKGNENENESEKKFEIEVENEKEKKQNINLHVEKESKKEMIIEEK